MAASPPEAGPPVVRTVADLRAAVAGWRAAGARVGLVPTMGALHEGHMALVHAAVAAADKVAAMIFVNPTQFGEGEDFAAYPRDEAGDLAKLAAAGADLTFIPAVDEVYPDGFATTVTVAGLTDGLCGVFRPGHFEGVATVVAKLLNQAGADVAFFGEKDYQQLQVIRRLARDLDIPVEIAGVATVRETDGLALSSRNAYLTPEQRRIAPVLQQTLRAIAADFGAGVRNGSVAAEWGRGQLAAAGFDPIDYVAVCDAETLAPIETADRPARVFAAAWLGRARLIDNVAVD
jgi:pantoate--beta-alanine ligase